MEEKEKSYFEAEEALPEALSLSFVVLEQVRRCLKAGSADMASEQSHTTIGKDGSIIQSQPTDPKKEYIACVRQLWAMVARKLPEAAKAELKTVEEEIADIKERAKTEEYGYQSWAMYGAMRMAFEIINNSLIEVDYFSSSGKRKEA